MWKPFKKNVDKLEIKLAGLLALKTSMREVMNAARKSTWYYIEDYDKVVVKIAELEKEIEILKR